MLGAKREGGLYMEKRQQQSGSKVFKNMNSN